MDSKTWNFSQSLRKTCILTWLFYAVFRPFFRLWTWNFFDKKKDKKNWKKHKCVYFPPANSQTELHRGGLTDHDRGDFSLYEKDSHGTHKHKTSPVLCVV
jgi:hypothetical protein